MDTSGMTWKANTRALVALGLAGVFMLAAAPAGVAQAQACEVTEDPAVVAEGNEFDTDCLAVEADTPFTLTLNNKDRFSHNISIYEAQGGAALYVGPYVPGRDARSFDVGAIPDGQWYFRCDIHPAMDGTFLSLANGASPSPGPASPTASPSTPSRRAPAGPTVSLERVASGLTAPVFLTSPPDGTKRLFIVDQIGQIRIVADGVLKQEPFLDVGKQLVKLDPEYDERGLLGLAFHPDFSTNKRFFIYYSAPLRPGAPRDWNHTARLSEYKVSASDPDLADPDSQRLVLQIDQPQSNHNGGHPAFGKDGLLYIPTGDGGQGNDVGVGHDPEGNGQTLTTLLGKVLRIDVDARDGEPYSIPEDNPFVNADPARPEIYAYGFRNPYHLSFDSESERLFVADSGQDRFEEVSIVTAGGNYGWRLKEGRHCFDPSSPSNPPADCPSEGADGKKLIDPVIEYGRQEIDSSVIIGGYLYRGSLAPALRGTYVFGDYSRDRVQPDGALFVATDEDGPIWTMRELRISIEGEAESADLKRFVLSFGEDQDKELYVNVIEEGGPTGMTGAVYRFVGVRGNAAASDNSSGLPPWAWIIAAVVAVGVGGSLLVSRSRRSVDGGRGVAR